MQHSTKSKRHSLSNDLVRLVLDNHFQIHMSIQERMYRLIPLPIKLLKRGGVPPIFIKLPMIQFRDLRKKVRKALKGHYEHDHDQ